MIDIDTSEKINTDNNDGIFINPNSFYSAYTFLNRNIYKADEFCDTVNKVDESTLNIVNCSFENIKSSVSSMKERLEQLSKNIQNMYDILIQDSDFANTFMYYGRQEMIEYFGEDLSEDELVKKIYQSAMKKDENKRSFYEKYIIDTYGEVIEKHLAFEEPLKEYQEQIQIEKEIEKLKGDRSTIEYLREGSEFHGYPTEEEIEKYDADIKKIDDQIKELEKKHDKYKKKELEDLLVENEIIESTAGAEFRIAVKKIYGSGVEFVDAVKSGNWENVKKEGKEFADIIFSTDAVVTTKVVSGVAKLGEWVDDGLRIAQGWIFGGNLVTGIDLLDKLAFGDEGKLKNNKIYQKASENWNEAMDYVSKDRVGDAQKYIFEETNIGRQINETSAVKYDGKFANATQNFTTNVAKYTAATLVTAFTGIPVITFVVGAVEGLGKNAEQYFSVTDENGNYKYRNAKGMGLSALGAVEEGANWYIAGNIGNSVLNTAKILHTQSASQVVNNVVSNLHMNKSLLSMNLGQEASKKVAKEALITTLKSPYLYIGTGANVANAIRTTEATGEFNLKNFVTREAFILASSFGGNYVQSKLNYSRIALTNQWMNSEVQNNAPALADCNNYAYSLLDEKGNVIAYYDESGAIINSNSSVAGNNPNVGLQVYEPQSTGLSIPNNINSSPDNVILFIRPELYLSQKLVTAPVDSVVGDINATVPSTDKKVTFTGESIDSVKQSQLLKDFKEKGMDLQLFSDKNANGKSIDAEELYDGMTFNNKKLESTIDDLYQHSKENSNDVMAEDVLKNLESAYEDTKSLQKELITSEKYDEGYIYDGMTFSNKKLESAMNELYQYLGKNPNDVIAKDALKKIETVYMDTKSLQRKIIQSLDSSKPVDSVPTKSESPSRLKSTFKPKSDLESTTQIAENGEIIRDGVGEITVQESQEEIPVFTPPSESEVANIVKSEEVDKNNENVESLEENIYEYRFYSDKVADFYKRNGIIPSEIREKVDTKIYQPSRISEIIDYYGHYRYAETKTVSIANIVGSGNLRLGVSDIYETLGEFFGGKTAHSYDSRSDSNLEKSVNEMLSSNSFVREPIRVQNMSTDSNNPIYMISSNGMHRFVSLRALYLNELSNNLENATQLNNKYSVQAEVTELHAVKTFSHYILNKFSNVKDLSLEFIRDSDGNIAGLSDNSRIFVDGKEIIVSDAELINMVKDVIEKNKDTLLNYDIYKNEKEYIKFIHDLGYKMSNEVATLEEKQNIFINSTKNSFESFLKNDNNGKVLSLFDEEGCELLEKSGLLYDRLGYVFAFSNHINELIKNEKFIELTVKSLSYLKFNNLSIESKNYLLNKCIEMKMGNDTFVQIFNEFDTNFQLELLDNWKYSEELKCCIFDRSNIGVMNKMLQEHSVDILSENINIVRMFEKAKGKIDIPADYITKELAQKIIEECKGNIFEIRNAINNASYSTDTTILEEYLRNYEENIILSIQNNSLISEYNEVFEAFKKFKSFEEDNTEWYDAWRAYLRILRKSPLAEEGQIFNIENSVDEVFETIKKANDEYVCNLIIDSTFGDNYYNIALNLGELLNFYYEGHIKLSQDKVSLYTKVLNMNTLSSNELIELYNQLNEVNIQEVFYDDISNARLIMREKIKEKSLDFSEMQKYKDEELSKKYGVDVYRIDHDNFYAIVKTGRHVSDSMPTGHSYSLIGNGKFNVYGDVEDANTFVYDASGLNPDQIVHVYPRDSFTFYRPFENSMEATDRINNLLMPEDLLGNTLGYNELLILEQGSKATGLDEDIKELKKMALYCVDDISQQAVDVAKSQGVGIFFIDTKTYDAQIEQSHDSYHQGLNYWNYTYYNKSDLPKIKQSIVAIKEKINSMSKSVNAINNVEAENISEHQSVQVPIEELESVLSKTGYICMGHGTGRSGNSDNIVDSIFENGLRTKDNSLYYTTIVLSTPTPELKQQYVEMGISEPTIDELKNQLNNWPHQDSKKIIIARIPIEYINTIGNASDLDGEKYGAFMIPRTQEDGRVINYLDPKFIVGCYDVDAQTIRLNDSFEDVLSESSIEKLQEGYSKALAKTEERIQKTDLLFNKEHNIENVESNTESYDLTDFDFEDDIDWDIPEESTSEIKYSLDEKLADVDKIINGKFYLIDQAYQIPTIIDLKKSDYESILQYLADGYSFDQMKGMVDLEKINAFKKELQKNNLSIENVIALNKYSSGSNMILGAKRGESKSKIYESIKTELIGDLKSRQLSIDQISEIIDYVDKLDYSLPLYQNYKSTTLFLEQHGISKSVYASINRAVKNYNSYYHLDETLKSLDSILQAEISKPMILYRAVNGNYLANKYIKGKDWNSLVGTIITEKGYLSTSPIYSKSFAKYDEFDTVFEIYAPKETQGVYIDPFSDYSGAEEEVLLNETDLYIFNINTNYVDENGKSKVLIKAIPVNKQIKSSNTKIFDNGEIVRNSIENVTKEDLKKEGISVFEPPTEPDLFDANNLQLSSNSKLRELQEKVISGQPLSMIEKVKIGRDNTFKELLGYKLKSNCAYRAVRREVFEKYKELGYVAGLNSNLEPLLDDEYLINENNKGVDWYLGGAAPKYGKIIIECPADKNYFVLAADSGSGMSNDPTVRFIKSSGSQKPIPFDKITRVIDLENNIIIENKNIQNNQSLNLSPKTENNKLNTSNQELSIPEKTDMVLSQPKEVALNSNNKELSPYTDKSIGEPINDKVDQIVDPFIISKEPPILFRLKNQNKEGKTENIVIAKDSNLEKNIDNKKQNNEDNNIVKYKTNILGKAIVTKVENSMVSCKVLYGLIRLYSKCRIIRNNVTLYESKISALQKDKNNISEVYAGFDCTIFVENFNLFQVNDIIEAYEIIKY